MRKATLQDEIKFLKKNNRDIDMNNLKIDGIETPTTKIGNTWYQLEHCIREFYPDAWKRYCKKEGLK